MRKALVYIFFLALYFNVYSQSFLFDNYTTKDGLSSDQVYDIYQDSNGYLWFATNRGICRYNGYAFETFDLEDGITDITVFRFFPQKNGKIWCSTFNNRIFYFDTNNYKFISYAYNDSLSEYAGNLVIGDILDVDSSILVSYKNTFGYMEIGNDGAFNSKIGIYQTKKIIQNNSTFYGVIDTSRGQSFSYVADSTSLFNSNAYINNKCIINKLPEPSIQYFEASILNNGNVAFLDKKTVTIKYNDLVKNQFDIGVSPLKVDDFSDSTFYISYQGKGFVVYDENLKNRFTLLENRSGTCVLRDHDGGYWFSTLYSGVYYLSSLNLRQYSIVEDAKVQGIAQDQNKNIWVSITKDSSALYYKNKEQFVKWESFSTSDIYPVSYDDQFLQMDWHNTTSFRLKKVKKIVSLRNGERYDVSARAFIKHDKENKAVEPILPGHTANDAAIFRGKYIVCEPNQVIYIENGKVVRDVHPILKQKMKDVEIFSGYEVYSTLGNGVVFYNADTLFSLTKENNLSSNIINRTYHNGDSVLWVCTSNGINKITFTNNLPKVTRNSNLENLNILDLEIISDTLWFTTMSGVFSFPINQFEFDNERNKLYLQWVDMIIRNLSDFDAKQLKYNQNNITFYYNAISFKKHNQLKYRYKLLPTQKEWQFTSNSSLSFVELPPGNYNLILEATVDDIYWEGINKSFKILPPFYNTWWFKTIVGLFIILIVYWFFKVRVFLYNQDVVREFFRLLNKRLKKKEKFLVIRESGNDLKINTHDILYVKSADNYLEIYTNQTKHTVRMKMGDFFHAVPDPLEYIRIHRSYIVRIDQIQSKSKDTVTVNQVELNVSKTYLKELSKVQF
jgi:ligand-binding sensor domain-containing protein